MRALLALVVLASVVGCKGGVAPPPAVPIAPKELRALTVFVDPKPIIDSPDAPDSHELAASDVPSSMIAALERDLAKSGFAVVHDRSAGADVSLQVDLDFSNPIERVMLQWRTSAGDLGRVEFVAQGDDGFELGNPFSMSQTELVDRVSNRFVQGLIGAPELRAFADARAKGTNGDAPPEALAARVDTDRDGLSDMFDKCPNDVGPAGNDGCPVAVPMPAEPSATHPASDSTAPLHTAAPQRTAFAVVVGIEKYRDLPSPPGARADAEHFAAVLRETLGLPEANVRVALDDHATRNDLERHLGWLRDSVPPNGRVYFFFSGHGAPDASKGTPYLVPYDGSAQAIEQTSVPVAEVMDALSKTRAKESIAFLDACFSGAGGRSVLTAGARPLVRVQEAPVHGALAVFASSTGSQISGPSADGREGAFTRFVVEALGGAKADVDGDGQITLSELSEWVTPRVEREARAQNREQTPHLTISDALGDPKNVAVEWGVH